MQKEILTVSQDEFEYARSVFDPAYHTLSWVNSVLKEKGVDLVFELNVIDSFEEEYFTLDSL